MAGLKKLPARFYATNSGIDPVREWLKRLDAVDRKAVGTDTATAEYGWPVGMPLTRSLGNSLFEIRTALSDGRNSRVIFTVTGREMVLLHAFIKKTRKTPGRDLDLAVKRLREISK